MQNKGEEKTRNEAEKIARSQILCGIARNLDLSFYTRHSLPSIPSPLPSNLQQYWACSTC